MNLVKQNKGDQKTYRLFCKFNAYLLKTFDLNHIDFIKTNNSAFAIKYIYPQTQSMKASNSESLDIFGALCIKTMANGFIWDLWDSADYDLFGQSF